MTTFGSFCCRLSVGLKYVTLASCIERGEAVPPAVLFAALSCALAFVPPRTRCFGLLAPVVAFLVSRLPVPPAWIEILFIGCWVSIAGTAALVHVRGGGGCFRLPRLRSMPEHGPGRAAGRSRSRSSAAADRHRPARRDPSNTADTGLCARPYGVTVGSSGNPSLLRPGRRSEPRLTPDRLTVDASERQGYSSVCRRSRRHI